MSFFKSYPIRTTFSGDLYVEPKDIINDTEFDDVLDAVAEIARLHGVE